MTERVAVGGRPPGGRWVRQDCEPTRGGGSGLEPWPGAQQNVHVCSPISCTSQCRLSGVEMPCSGLVLPLEPLELMEGAECSQMTVVLGLRRSEHVSVVTMVKAWGLNAEKRCHLDRCLRRAQWGVREASWRQSYTCSACGHGDTVILLILAHSVMSASRTGGRAGRASRWKCLSRV